MRGRVYAQVRGKAGPVDLGQNRAHLSAYSIGHLRQVSIELGEMLGLKIAKEISHRSRCYRLPTHDGFQSRVILELL